ncbi:MAG: putative rane protein [Polaromonas sp.]|nr:putative rane protein [Polaromonas sp.]
MIPPTSDRHLWRWHLAALLSTLALTALLHGAALTMGFARDDGFNLFNAARLSPLTYFFDPATLKAVSASALTPWNLLVYDINVTLFGLDPRWHHLHLLAVVWACAMATWMFLRLWLPEMAALLAALLFLTGTPVVFISHEQMSGHYLYGLLFTILAAWSFVAAVRSGGAGLALLSGLLYMLATSCKEVFVPLPVALLLLPEGTLARRLRVSWALWLAVAAYTGWRWVVFDGSLLGPRGVPLQPQEALRQVAGMAPLLFSQAWILLPAAVILAVWRKALSAREALFLLVLAAILVAPLLPVTSGVGLHEPDRLLLLVWWTLACVMGAFAWRVLGQRRMAMVALMIAAGAMQVWLSQPWRAEIAQVKQRWSQWYGAVLDPRPGMLHLVLTGDGGYFWQKFHLDGMRMAARALGQPFNPQVQVIDNQDDLAEAGADPSAFATYDAALGRLRTASGPQELRQWAAALPRRQVDVYVFRRMPQMAFNPQGTIERVQAHGAVVTVTGAVPPSDLGRNFLVLSPVACGGTVAHDPAGTMRGRFELTLACADAQAARQAAGLLCVAVASGSQISVPAGHPGGRCDRLTWQHHDLRK